MSRLMQSYMRHSEPKWINYIILFNPVLSWIFQWLPLLCRKGSQAPIGGPYTLSMFHRNGSSRPDHGRCHQKKLKAKCHKFNLSTSGFGWAGTFNTSEDPWHLWAHYSSWQRRGRVMRQTANTSQWMRPSAHRKSLYPFNTWPNHGRCPRKNLKA